MNAFEVVALKSTPFTSKIKPDGIEKIARPKSDDEMLLLVRVASNVIPESGRCRMPNQSFVEVPPNLTCADEQLPYGIGGI